MPLTLTRLQERPRIEAYLRRHPSLHLYEIGDLDDFFWPSTRWYGLEDAGGIRALALLYTAFETPVLIALSGGEGRPALETLLRRLAGLLPPSFYAHLSPGLETVLSPARQLIDHGLHRKMALADPQPARQSDVRGVERLGPQHAAELHALYAASYPENAFDPRLLATGRFFGLWEDGRLVSAAGVHVYSAAYRVAALGNIATLPARRSRGLAQRVTARLCQELLAENIALIGLNVKAGNAPALACYRRLGFTPVAEYHEWTFTAQDS